MRRRVDRERGATAVMVGLLSVLLFTVASLAVDLGNAWARKRAVQKQVDVSALAAGYLLPMTPANALTIANEVASYMELEDNHVTGQAEVTGTQLLNGDPADGEVTFHKSDGSACITNCTQMKVVAPSARVDFGLAGIMGYDNVDVTRTATVRVVSELPDPVDLIPFWLPSGCGYGPAEADTTQGGGPSSSPTPTTTASPSGSGSATPSAAPTGFVPAPGDTGNHLLAGTTPLAVGHNGTATASNWSITNIGGNPDRASLRFYAPDGSRFIDFAAHNIDKGVFNIPAFTIGQEITATSGAWRVYALVSGQGQGAQPKHSANFHVVDVAPGPSSPATSAPASATPSTVPISCVGQDRGNFGQLDSPRKDGSTGNKRLARNIAGGLDHLLQPFLWAPGQTVTKDCGSNQHGFIPGAHPDNVSSSSPPRNCIKADPGNDGPAIYDGLVTGADNGTPGRLSAVNGSTSPLCNPTRSNTTVGGVSLNNDVLSCFLRNGAKLADIASSAGVTQTMLDPRVVDSPRFIWLPMVVATDRAQKEFQPIVDFVPAFITDETQTSQATSANGVVINGNSVQVMRVFTFNKEALPIDQQSPTIDYQPSGRSIVRLVG